MPFWRKKMGRYQVPVCPNCDAELGIHLRTFSNDRFTIRFCKGGDVALDLVGSEKLSSCSLINVFCASCGFYEPTNKYKRRLREENTSLPKV